MFDEPFQHYLAYGASDQRTVLELADSFTGLIVPGTIAAFQREGTGGFVLTLSASQSRTPYAIDPRFPLFQQSLSAPKKSHNALADILEGQDLILENEDPLPAAFTDGRIDQIASNWVSFNSGYRDAASSKFNKYAERLNEPVLPEDRAGPSYVLSPYTVAEGVDDPWWAVSTGLHERTIVHAAQPENCVRVVAAKEARFLDGLLGATDLPRVAIWVSGLNELTRPSHVLSDYARAIMNAANDGKRIFALYGGFFSVLLSSVGLSGSSHGIGYGESRAYLELPRSGPPPARYYLPLAHRYVSHEFAYQLWQIDPSLAECSCAVCERQSPIDLDYHELMRHSVLCRSLEIETWVGLDLPAIIGRLKEEYKTYIERLDESNAPQIIRDRVEENTAHLLKWADALEEVQ